MRPRAAGVFLKNQKESCVRKIRAASRVRRPGDAASATHFPRHASARVHSPLRRPGPSLRVPPERARVPRVRSALRVCAREPRDARTTPGEQALRPFLRPLRRRRIRRRAPQMPAYPRDDARAYSPCRLWSACGGGCGWIAGSRKPWGTSEKARANAPSAGARRCHSSRSSQGNWRARGRVGQIEAVRGSDAAPPPRTPDGRARAARWGAPPTSRVRGGGGGGRGPASTQAVDQHAVPACGRLGTIPAEEQTNDGLSKRAVRLSVPSKPPTCGRLGWAAARHAPRVRAEVLLSGAARRSWSPNSERIPLSASQTARRSPRRLGRTFSGST